MKILSKTSKGIRPEFWGWSSYTQQACQSDMFVLCLALSPSLPPSLPLSLFPSPPLPSLSLLFCSTKASIQIHVDNDLLYFHKGEKALKSINSLSLMHQFCKLNIFRTLLSENRVCRIVGVETLLFLCSYSLHFRLCQ